MRYHRVYYKPRLIIAGPNIGVLVIDHVEPSVNLMDCIKHIIDGWFNEVSRFN